MNNIDIELSKWYKIQEHFSKENVYIHRVYDMIHTGEFLIFWNGSSIEFKVQKIFKKKGK